MYCKKSSFKYFTRRQFDVILHLWELLSSRLRVKYGLLATRLLDLVYKHYMTIIQC